MTENTPETGQAGELPEIEVTPQMIEAGVRELSEWRFVDAPERIVWFIYAAMEYARLDRQGSASASATSCSR